MKSILFLLLLFCITIITVFNNRYDNFFNSFNRFTKLLTQLAHHPSMLAIQLTHFLLLWHKMHRFLLPNLPMLSHCMSEQITSCSNSNSLAKVKVNSCSYCELKDKYIHCILFHCYWETAGWSYSNTVNPIWFPTRKHSGVEVLSRLRLYCSNYVSVFSFSIQ